MCDFDRNGVCFALACYSAEKCSARDKYGNPKYHNANVIDTHSKENVQKEG